MVQPIRLYLDQMVVSTAADVVDWRTGHYVGRLLAPLVVSGDLRIRPSLAHFSETVLYVDTDEEHDCILQDTEKLDKRQRIAEIICAVSDFEHTIPRWEVFALRDLASILASLVPSAVNLAALDELQQLDGIGLRSKLEALAANRTAHNADFYAHSWKSKLLTQLFQIKVREKAYLDALLKDVESGDKVALGVDDILAQLPLHELRGYVSSRLKDFEMVDPTQARQQWQRNRKQIENAYTVDSLLRTLGFFLESTEPLPPVFNVRELTKNWSQIEARIGKVRLPDPLPDFDAALKGGLPRVAIVSALFQPIVERLLTAADLPTSRTAMYVAVLQVEAALGGQIPGTGNVFDCERAIALHEVDVFHTTDERLVRHAKQARSHFGLRVDVVDSEKELRRVIARLQGERAREARASALSRP